MEEEEQGNEGNEQDDEEYMPNDMMKKWMTLVNPHITVQLKPVLVVKKMQWMILIWEIFRVSSIYLAAAS
jgi:hypothetical protein